LQPGLTAGAAANSLVFAVGLPVLRQGLTGPGIVHAWLLGCVVFGVFGAGSYALMCLYFVTGTLVSRRERHVLSREKTAGTHTRNV
jgi:uncharacterized membrane protein